MKAVNLKTLFCIFGLLGVCIFLPLGRPDETYAQVPPGGPAAAPPGDHNQRPDKIRARDKEKEKGKEAAKDQKDQEEVQRVTSSTKIGQDLMGEVYGADTSKPISVTDKSTESRRNIDEGQKFLSMGVMTGFKNPAVSHTSITQGLINGNFTDRDCLDILSTISYLYTRLENRTSP